MSIDVVGQIGAITRQVSQQDHRGRPARVIVAHRTYSTSPEDVWDAITNPERIPRWFLPVSGDLRLGGRYQLQGNAGGEITECDAPRRLALTWEFGGEVSWVEVRLTGQGEGRTRLELEHIAHVDDERWQQFGPGAVGVGWDMTLFGLDQHLGGRAEVDRENAEAWMMSPEGKQFMKRSSDAWGSASIASGTRERDALDAAARTVAFYTGEAPPSSGT